MTANQEAYEPNFVLTSVIFEGLEPAREPVVETSYLIHPDYPAIFIKMTSPGYSRKDADIDTIRQEFQAYHQLEAPGIRVVPFSVVEHVGELAVVAHRVDGVELEEEMQKNPQAVSQYDEVLAHQITKLAEIRGQDKNWPHDSFGPKQCMWGRLWGEQEHDGIIYVDIHSDGNLIVNATHFESDEAYFGELLDIAEILADARHDANQEFPVANERLLHEVETIKGAVQQKLGPRGYENFVNAISTYDRTVIEEIRTALD